MNVTTDSTPPPQGCRADPAGERAAWRVRRVDGGTAWVVSRHEYVRFWCDMSACGVHELPVSR
ncbi:hypothetical protein [Nonomuraea sp. NPDC005650]|uniref:hypothetical protein n=1 Tax=Nonomuraea sp. NPDC005650 TaxID=3157045 RepID=UPI0033A4C3CC